MVLECKQSNVRRKKVKEEHKEWLKETLEDLQGQYFKIKGIREKLIKEYP